MFILRHLLDLFDLSPTEATALIDRAIALKRESARGQRPATLPDEGALARRLLAIATAEGARALALDDRLGALAPGKLADLAVLDLDVGDDDPYVAVLDRASAAGVRCTVLGGRVVHGAATVRR